MTRIYIWHLAGITETDLETALAPFRGDIMQVPPMYSGIDPYHHCYYTNFHWCKNFCNHTFMISIYHIWLLITPSNYCYHYWNQLEIVQSEVLMWFFSYLITSFKKGRKEALRISKRWNHDRKRTSTGDCVLIKHDKSDSGR